MSEWTVCRKVPVNTLHSTNGRHMAAHTLPCMVIASCLLGWKVIYRSQPVYQTTLPEHPRTTLLPGVQLALPRNSPVAATVATP